MRSVNVDEAFGGMREGRRDEYAGTRRTRRDGANHQLVLEVQLGWRYIYYP